MRSIRFTSAAGGGVATWVVDEDSRIVGFINNIGQGILTADPAFTFGAPTADAVEERLIVPVGWTANGWNFAIQQGQTLYVSYGTGSAADLILLLEKPISN